MKMGSFTAKNVLYVSHTSAHYAVCGGILRILVRGGKRVSHVQIN